MFNVPLFSDKHKPIHFAFLICDMLGRDPPPPCPKVPNESVLPTAFLVGQASRTGGGTALPPSTVWQFWSRRVTTLWPDSCGHQGRDWPAVITGVSQRARWRSAAWLHWLSATGSRNVGAPLVGGCRPTAGPPSVQAPLLSLELGRGRLR